MGFYLRKAVKVGPFRFNLSKSGVGVSAGIRGLRLGTGPRGNYIHMGRGGLYYRKTLPAAEQIEEAGDSDDVFDIPRGIDDDPGHEPLQAIDSGDVNGMVDSSSAELVEELISKRKKRRLWPSVLALGMIGIWYPYVTDQSQTVVIGAVVVTILLTLVAAARDRLAKSTVLIYDIEDDYESTYQSLHDAFEEMQMCKKKWHMTASGRVTDKKRHAGADNVVSRNEIKLAHSQPEYVKTNVEVPSIPVGSQTLYFFPDRVLVFEKNGVGVVGYENIEVASFAQQFIEDEGVPSDAQIVDHTWRFVNKSGGPDRRFSNNKKLPIALYETVTFKSPTGLNEEIQLSKADSAQGFAQAIQVVGRDLGARA